jgi:hypothetical protein
MLIVMSRKSQSNLLRCFSLVGVICAVLSGAGCDDDSSELSCLRGKVLHAAPCSNENGAVWVVEIYNIPGIDQIATSTLPETYQKEGQVIFFGLKAATGHTYCTANITLPVEYDVKDVASQCRQDD